MTDQESAKVCAACKRERPLSDFQPRGDGSNKPRFECKDCSAKRGSQYRRSGPWWPMSAETEAKYWKKVAKVDVGCWEWLGERNPRYGRARFYAPPKQLQASWVAWALATGAPPTLQVLHKCDNPGCVRPDHLFQGTNSDNIADAIRKGRHRKVRPRRRLSEEQERVVAADYWSLGVAEAARKHGLPQTTVWSMGRRAARCGS